jgi:hypothetical protein
LEKIAAGYGLDVSELLAPDLRKIRAPKAPARRLPLRKKYIEGLNASNARAIPR